MEACGLAPHAPELFRGGGRCITGAGVAHRRADGCLRPSLAPFGALSRRQKAAFIAALDGFCGVMQGAVRAAWWRGITCACARLREPHPSCGSAAVKFLLGMRSEGGGTAAAHGGECAVHAARGRARWLFWSVSRIPARSVDYKACRAFSLRPSLQIYMASSLKGCAI